MSSEDKFTKPKSASPSPLSSFVKGALANANVAREMVNLHLQGRNPQRQQNSGVIHARVKQEQRAASVMSLSRPNSGAFRENGVASGGPGRENLEVQRQTMPQSAGTNARIPGSSFTTKTPKSAQNLASVTQTRPGEPTVKAMAQKSQVSVPAKSHVGPCKNPQCAHCGSVIIPSPKASFPLKEQPSISVNDWSIYTTKGPICLSEELDHLNDTRFEFPLPEMIFGNNRVVLVNEKSGATIDFNTLDALDSLASTADFKVAYHKEWLSTRPKAKASDLKGAEEADSGHSSSSSSIKTSVSDHVAPTSPDLQSVKPYDWTYSTNYRGTLKKCRFKGTGQEIPLEKLVRQDPILFYDESILFEDELGDNGISMLSTKIRVMHSCLLLLCRFSMRVDDVAFRIRDTRVYIDLETNLVLREYKVQQALYAELLGKVSGRSSDPKKLLRDSNWVSQNTPVVLREVEIMEEVEE